MNIIPTLVAILLVSANTFCMNTQQGVKSLDRQSNPPDVEFLFWNRKQPVTWSWSEWRYVSTPESIRFNKAADTAVVDALLDALSDINKAGQTIFIIHGWTENGRAAWIQDMKNAFIWKGYPNVSPTFPNVISVDWESLAAPEYPEAAGNTQPVGVHVADFISHLLNRGDYSFTLDDIHVIGFSLGAQVSGRAGKTLGGNLARITGLDPAGGGFDGEPSDKRLDKGDAKFVDVIHTSKQASHQAAGHLDFWPNGGNADQPGCTAFDEFSRFVCSHMRAVQYYTESIKTPGGFRAVKCASYANYQSCRQAGNNEALMGESATKPTVSASEGNYYLETNAWAPYARG